MPKVSYYAAIILPARFEVLVETGSTWLSCIRLGQAHYETDIWVWLRDGLDQFERRSCLELEEKNEMQPETWRERENVWFRNWICIFWSLKGGFIPLNRRWFYSPNCRETKMGLKENKRMGRKKKWVFNNVVMGSHALPNGYLGICTMSNEYRDIYTMGNEYGEINRNVNIVYKNLI